MRIDLLVTQSITDTVNTWTLTSRIGEMLGLAQELFGKVNSELFFLGIEFKDDGPRIRYQDPGYIIIQLTPLASEHEFMAYYQLSHEVYHLLSPTGKYDSNVLEEGLATYFSKIYLETLAPNNTYWEISTILAQNYYRAYQLVDQLLQIDSNIIKKVRTVYPQIKTSHLSINEFESIMKDITPYELLDELLRPFINI